MHTNTKVNIAASATLFIIIGAAVGYLYGYQKAYVRGRYDAEKEIMAMQEQARQQATLEAAAEVNPFTNNTTEPSPLNPFNELETNVYK